MKTEFADNLVYYRKQYSLTQADLADLLLVSQATVSKWESGCNEPNLYTLKNLADLFDVPIDVLVGRKDF